MARKQYFCLKCGGSHIEDFKRNKRLMFHCLDCGKISSRVLIFGDSKLVKTKKGYKHFSVGAIIKEGKKILLTFPHDFPFKYKFPSGHIKKNESPANAIKREVREETELEVTASKLLFHEILDCDPCSWGVDIHEWYLFEVKTKGKPNVSEEVLQIGWYSPSQIKNLKMNKVYQYWLEKIGLIKKK